VRDSALLPDLAAFLPPTLTADQKAKKIDQILGTIQATALPPIPLENGDFGYDLFLSDPFRIAEKRPVSDDLNKSVESPRAEAIFRRKTPDSKAKLEIDSEFRVSKPDKRCFSEEHETLALKPTKVPIQITLRAPKFGVPDFLTDSGLNNPSRDIEGILKSAPSQEDSGKRTKCDKDENVTEPIAAKTEPAKKLHTRPILEQVNSRSDLNIMLFNEQPESKPGRNELRLSSKHIQNEEKDRSKSPKQREKLRKVIGGKLPIEVWTRLSIQVLSGSQLCGKDPDGLSDPFIKIKYGNWCAKTKVIKKTLAPQWNETFILDRAQADTTDEFISFLCVNWNAIGKSSYMGECVVRVADVPEDGERSYALISTKPKQTVSGSIQFHFKRYLV